MPSRDRAPWRSLLRRWPSALAVGAAIVILDGGATDGSVTALGELLPVLPLVYVIVVAMPRRGATWLVLLLGAAAADPGLARYLVGTGWFLHGIWDFVHLYRDEGVARSFAECCGVLDIIIGLHLLVLA